VKKIIEFLKSIIPIRVWTLYHDNMGMGFSVNKNGLDDIGIEIIQDFYDCSHTKEIQTIIDHFIDDCKNLEPGQSKRLGQWNVKCQWTTQRSLDKYPEFEGW
jgi:hypothetical protein